MFFAQTPELKCSSGSLPTVETPAGDIAFSIELNKVDVTAKFSDCFDLQNGEKLFRYELAEATFEVLIFHNDFKLLPHQHVDECLTCAIRLTAKVDGLELRFAGACYDNCPDGGGNPGERLMAVTWEDAQTVISLGTGDSEWHYPHAGESFPSRWKKFVAEYEPLDYPDEHVIPFIKQIEQRGLVFEPPELFTGESCQLAFAVAWANLTPETGISTWVAVDYAHEIKKDKFLPFKP